MLCPGCAQPLESSSTEDGVVWICHACHAAAANIAVVRKVAPKRFVKYLWIAAHESGQPSVHCCPSCEQPLLRFADEVELSPRCEICCRCFLLWFDTAELTTFRAAPPEATRRRSMRMLSCPDEFGFKEINAKSQRGKVAKKNEPL